jgi:hypothetical protein
MDDKIELAALMQRIHGSLEAIDKSVNEIASVMQTLRDRSDAELKQRMAQLNAIAATPKFASGRWTRRDGDGFANLPSRSAIPLPDADAAKHGDGSSGNL